MNFLDRNPMNRWKNIELDKIVSLWIEGSDYLKCG
jgi:hypothetical protein